jgi:uncharacterized membrane protein
VVTSERLANGLRIVAKPDHSSSWRSNQLLLLLLAVPSLGAGIFFALLGAWPILPLAGLELSALAAALYHVNWKLQYRQVITVDASAVRIDEGRFAPVRSWQLERGAAALAVVPERHPWEGPRLSVYSRDLHVPVGAFLNREDCLSLLGILRRELRIGTHSPATEQRL